MKGLIHWSVLHSTAGGAVGESRERRRGKRDYDKDQIRRIPTKLGLDNWKAILVTGQGQINLIGGLGWKFNVDYGSFIICPETQRQPRQWRSKYIKNRWTWAKKNKKEICEFLKYAGASLSWEENHLAQHVKRTPQYVAQTHEASQALELKATWGRSTT